jgi:hypothetical protein
MGVTMGELFHLEGRTVAVDRGVAATLRRVGPSVEVCFEGVGGSVAYVMVQEGHLLGDGGCVEGGTDVRRFCPVDLDELDHSVVEVRSLAGARVSRSLTSIDAARLSA